MLPELHLFHLRFFVQNIQEVPGAEQNAAQVSHFEKFWRKANERSLEQPLQRISLFGESGGLAVVFYHRC